MDEDRNIIILGLISGSLFANAEFLLRSHNNSADENLNYMNRPLQQLPLQKEADLTFVKGPEQKAQGQVIYIKGIVRGMDYRPLNNASVEILQTNKFGQYTPAKQKDYFLMDTNFRGHGRCLTNKFGEYLFKTILPGESIGQSNEIEPRQIHFTVKLADIECLKTKMYFSRHHELTKNDKGMKKGVDKDLISNFHRPDFNSVFEKNSYVIFFPMVLNSLI